MRTNCEIQRVASAWVRVEADAAVVQPEIDDAQVQAPEQSCSEVGRDPGLISPRARTVWICSRTVTRYLTIAGVCIGHATERIEARKNAATKFLYGFQKPQPMALDAIEPIAQRVRWYDLVIELVWELIEHLLEIATATCSRDG